VGSILPPSGARIFQEIKASLHEEKGIDVRLALDVVRMALGNLYVALIFSQDQDLSEAWMR